MAEKEQWYDLRDGRVFVNRAPKDFTEWENAISAVAALKRNNPFWIGDMLNIGEDTFGESYSQVVDDFGFHNSQVIANYKYVARNVDPKVRRMKNLFWAHHRTVAGYEQADQSLLLSWCEKLKFNTVEFTRTMTMAREDGISIKELVAFDQEALEEWREEILGNKPDRDHYSIYLQNAIDNLDKAIEFCEDKNARDLLSVSKDSALDAQELNVETKA